MTMLRVCKCGILIPATSRRCDACNRADSQRRNQRTRRDGRHLATWNKTRTTVLNRDNHTCQDCGGHATGVHRKTGGYHTPDPDQYVALCTPCHGRRDRHRQHAMGGAPLAPKNPQPPKPPTSFPREILADATKNGPVEPLVA